MAAKTEDHPTGDHEHQLRQCRCTVCGKTFHDWEPVERFIGHNGGEVGHYGSPLQVQNLYGEWDEYEVGERCRVCGEEQTRIDKRNYEEFWG